MSDLRDLPPLEWLRAFEAAARLSGFTAAAQELGLTQAAISQRIRNLEAHLGRSLFLRRNRGVELTVDGESYLPVVQSAFRKLSFGTESLFGTAPTELRIGALGSHCRNGLLPALGRFAACHPKLRLVVESIAKRSEYDAASAPLQIRFGRGDWPGLRQKLLAQERLRPMAAPGYCDRPEADWLRIELRGERPGWREWEAQTGHSAPAAHRLRVDSMEQAFQLAMSGAGLALASEFQTRSLRAQGQLIPLDWPELETADGYWLTWPKSFVRAAAQKQLIADLAAELSSDPGVCTP